MEEGCFNRDELEALKRGENPWSKSTFPPLTSTPEHPEIPASSWGDPHSKVAESEGGDEPRNSLFDLSKFDPSSIDLSHLHPGEQNRIRARQFNTKELSLLLNRQNPWTRSGKPQPLASATEHQPHQPSDSQPTGGTKWIRQQRGATPKERADAELRSFMPTQVRAEYEKAEPDKRKVIWGANKRAFEAAQKRKKERLLGEQKLIEEVLDMVQRVKEDPSKAHLLPPADASISDLHEWFEKMSQPMRNIPFPIEGGQYPQGTVAHSATPFAQDTRNQEALKPIGRLAEIKTAPMTESNRKHGGGEVWAEIKKHRGWYILVFLLSGLPIYIATLWGPIMGSKTIPEWLAESGWPRLSTLVLAWLAGVAAIGLVIIARSFRAARHQKPEPSSTGAELRALMPEVETPQTMVRQASQSDKKTKVDLSVKQERVWLEKTLSPSGDLSLVYWHVTICLYITNRHEFDNAIRDYGLTVILPDGQELKGKIESATRLVSRSTGEELVDLRPSLDVPLKQGHPTRRAVRFLFSSNDLDLNLAGVNYVLRIQDVYDMAHKPKGTLPEPSDDLHWKISDRAFGS